MELYCKIPCAERLPEKEGVYDTIMGRLLFYEGTFYENQYSSDFHGNHFAPVTPEYWYELIQLPTYEEIEKIISELQKGFHFGFDIDSWKSGFKLCLELLTK